MITHFDIEIYAYRVHVLHNVTDAQFTKYFADTFKCEVERTNYGASVWQMENKSGRKESVIDFKNKLIRDGWSLNTIVHECEHVTFDIMEYIGMELDYKTNHEAFCYLMGHITERVYKIIYKKESKK